MNTSKRYIKKQNNKPLINKKVLAKVIRESNICKHAIKELKLAGYGNGEGGPNLANYGTRRKSKRINKMVYGYLWC